MSSEKTQQLHPCLGWTPRWGCADGWGPAVSVLVEVSMEGVVRDPLGLRIQLLSWNPVQPPTHCRSRTEKLPVTCQMLRWQASRSPGKQKHGHVFCLSWRTLSSSLGEGVKLSLLWFSPSLSRRSGALLSACPRGMQMGLRTDLDLTPPLRVGSGLWPRGGTGSYCRGDSCHSN